MTVEEYSEKYKISKKSVCANIKKGNLKAQKIKGKWEIQEESTPAGMGAESEYEIKLKLDNELKREKLKNLRQDTEIKKLKQQFHIEKIRLDFAQDIYTSFTSAFSDFTFFLQDLNLQKEEAEKLNFILQEALKKFKVELQKKLKGTESEFDSEEISF